MKPNDLSSNPHYQGSSIIHMLEHSLGEETLRAGLKKYLDKHKFNNAVTRCLCPSLLHLLIQHFDVVTNNTTGIFGEPLALLLTED